MISEGQKYIKKRNGLKFIITDVIGENIHFQEVHYFNTRVMNEKDFLEMFELEMLK